MLKVKYIFITFFIFLFITILSAQEKFENITLKNGLASNRVHNCVKDTRGFIWLTTDNGICRYDGIKFQIFNNKPENKSGLVENIFYDVYQISHDELIFLSFNGRLYTYSYKTGKFTNLSEKIASIKNISIVSFHKSRKGEFWFSTDKGLILTDAGFNLLKEFVIKDFVKGSVSNRVMTICEDKNGIFWLGMVGRTVERFDPKTGKFYDMDNLRFMPRLNQVKTIINSPDSNYVFIGTSSAGLFKVNIHNNSYKNWNTIAGNSNSIPSVCVTSLCIQNDSILWVGTLDGLAKLNMKTNSVKRLLNNPLHPYSLVNNYVNYLYHDSQNNLWALTFGGISKYYTQPPRFIKISQNSEEPNTIASNKITNITRDKSGNLWLATTKGIDIKPEGLNKYFHYNLPKSFPRHNNEDVVFFFIENDDTWWVGTWGGGISRFRLPDKFKPGDPISFTNFYYDSSDVRSISTNFIRSFDKDKEGNIWISTWNGGLNKINAADKNKEKIPFERYLKGTDPLKEVISNYILEVRVDDDYLWLSTGHGLQHINIKKKHAEVFFPDRNNPESPINTSTCIHIDKEGNVWHGTYGGLVKIVKGKDSKYSIETIFYDPDNKHGIYSLTQDKKGLIWFTTLSSEVGSFNPQTGELKFYSMIEETDGFDFYLGEPLAANNGSIYFTGNSGYIYFNPDFMPENKLVPPVYINSIKVNNEEYRPESDITGVKQIALEYDQRNISIGFAALNYINPHNNQYKYILEGLEPNWILLKNSREIYFANLPAGTYKLKIMGSNNDGIWNSNAAELDIVIYPPFWQNNYFRLAFLFAVMASVYWFINRKIKRLKLDKIRQNQFSKLMIESQENERKRLSGELHDGLGQNLLVIKNQLDIYKGTLEMEEPELDKISNLIKESLSEVKEISSYLHPHQLERLGLTKAIKAMVHKISESCNIEIDLVLADINECIQKESEINIYRIIQESLNNIVKHSGAQKARVIITKEGNNITIIVEDFGKGYDISDRELQNKIGEGLGLKGIKERVRLINGELYIDSLPDKGTKIRIVLQCRQ
ncbi:MAG: hypothetical protein C0412_04090 [Flavobacterium sp.]|nr:hypothetical protein [Flavobacterium sp.]